MKYNPLSPLLPTASWADYSTWKSHLLLPVAYQKIIFRNYRDLTQVPAKLPELNYKLNEHLWMKMKEPTLEQKMYKVSGIPVAYMDNPGIPACKADVMKAYTTISRNIGKFCGQGRVLYLHSTMESNSLLAASNIVKSAIGQNISSYMIDMPTVVQELTSFDDSAKLKKLDSVELGVIYFVGKEYAKKETGFVSSWIDSCINRRLASKKTTILVSHLDENNYEKRYGLNMCGTVLSFIDDGIKQTISDLVRELEG